MSRGAWKAATVAAMLVLAACDSKPNGPGTLSVVVTGGNLGAVVLEASGKGILGFQGQKGATAYSALVQPGSGAQTESVYRVIVVSPVAGDLSFGVRVADVSATKPTFAVIDATDGANATLSGTGLQVRVLR